MTDPWSSGRQGQPALRPGVQILYAAEDKVHLSFANHTATFTGVQVVRSVKSLISEFGAGRDAIEVVRRASAVVGYSPDFLNYVLALLESSHCLWWSQQSTDADSPFLDELAIHFAAIGENPSEIAHTLEESKPLVVAPVPHAAFLQASLETCGIGAEVRAYPAGTPLDCLRAILMEARDAQRLVASWGFPYRSVAARIVNSFAVDGLSVLFGSCEGRLGRIGPFVMGRETACLECLNVRLITNGGIEELSVSLMQKSLSATDIPPPAPAHPAFICAVSSFYALELQGILLKRPPRTISRVLEFSEVHASSVHRTVLKAPRCEACSRQVPRRFAWNTTVSSPKVKDGSVGN